MFFVLVLVSLALLFGISRVERRLDTQVAQYNLRFTGQIKNAPPMVVFTTVALGSFRGLVADLLWLRAGALQEKGNYFEMVQLARWITDLQPTFSGATAYLAWNMAYNISVTCSSFADRWRWVNEGIKLIRDQAIEYNPEDPLLYKELAWIFQHKLGNIMDDANLYYKNRLAIQMTNIVGTGNPDWKALAATPASEEAFRKAYPPDHRFWQAAKEAGYEDFDAVYNAFRSAEPAALPGKLITLLGGADSVLVGKLTDFFRAEYLRRSLKLDPALIVEINEKYGLMDWRVPESQAIYWATLGLKRTPGHVNLDCNRIITQSLYEAFRAGKLLMIDDRSFESIIVVPNLALVDAVFDTYVKAQETFDKGNSASTFRSARINFMKEAVTILYNYGKFTKAEEYYQKLIKEDGKKHPNIEAFIMDEWAEDVRDAAVKKASEIISGLIFRSINYMVYNDQDAAIANERIARYIYTKYAADLGKEDRTKLPSYAEMKRSVVENCLKIFPPAMVAILKAKIAEEQAEAAVEQKTVPPVKNSPDGRK